MPTFPWENPRESVTVDRTAIPLFHLSIPFEAAHRYSVPAICSRGTLDEYYIHEYGHRPPNIERKTPVDSKDAASFHSTFSRTRSPTPPPPHGGKRKRGAAPKMHLPSTNRSTFGGSSLRNRGARRGRGRDTRSIAIAEKTGGGGGRNETTTTTKSFTGRTRLDD